MADAAPLGTIVDRDDDAVEEEEGKDAFPSDLRVAGGSETPSSPQEHANARSYLQRKLNSLQKQLRQLEQEETGLADMDEANETDPQVLEMMRAAKLTQTEIDALKAKIVEFDSKRSELGASETMDYRALYNNERNHTYGLEAFLKNQGHEIDASKEEVAELKDKLLSALTNDSRDDEQKAISLALQTPMESAVHSIINLIAKCEKTHVTVPLAKVLKCISAANVHEQKFGFAETESDSDRSTQTWLRSTFSGGSSPTSAAARQTLHDPSASPNRPVMKKRVRRSSVVMRTMQSFDFDQFKVAENDLADLARDYFTKWSLFEEFKVPATVYPIFMRDVRAGYRKNPYHNYRHAFDVTQMLYSLLTLTDAADFLNPLDIYVLLICGIVHDVDHDGVNNTFHINSRSHLANVYNDLSVLENHHCHFAMTILARKESDMFGGMSEAQLKEARQKMISCILATDMGKHFDVTNKFKVRLQAQSFTKEKAEDRQIFADVLLHAADVGNTTRPYKIAKKWAGFLMQEFGAQGDMEKKLELPVSPLCNRDTLSTPKEVAKSQMDFIDFVISPMFNMMCTGLMGLEPLIANLTKNRKTWQAVYDVVEEEV